MSHLAMQKVIKSLDSNLPRSLVFQKHMPLLAEAFHAESMRQILHDALFGPNNKNYSIVSCTPGKALYLPDHISNMQYQLTILDKAKDQTMTTLVNARLFQDVSTCKAYLTNTLSSIAARMSGRPDIKPFAHPVAIVEPLHMALSVFPIDGLIPTLVDATDPNKIASILAETLPDVLSGEFSIKEVQLLLAHYGRYERCVLRYSIDGMQNATQTPHTITVYGKVGADGLGSWTVTLLSALRERLHEPGVPYRFRIPRALGYFPDLKLLMMEALPGKPFFKELFKKWVENTGQGNGDENIATEHEMTLEPAIRTCALIAATLHSSDIKLGLHNTLEMQVAELRDESEDVGRIFPELGAQIKSWLDQTVEFAQDYPAIPLCFSHGDFRYTQLIFEGKNGGLVDFDTICQAEPAQDLGQFLAYQRLSIMKTQDPNSPVSPEAIERLCALFLDTYIDASKNRIADEGGLRGRVAIYELISLIRLALHSWEKLKGSRLKQTLSLLEERIECQKQISL